MKSRHTDDGLRDYHPESRKCYFENEKPLTFFKTYTKLNCEWECLAFEALKKCSCVMYNMPRNKSMKVCNNEELLCDLRKEIVSCSDSCYPTCNDITFEMVSEFSQITEEIYKYYNTSKE
jgi:acid-sensing ion channel, other